MKITLTGSLGYIGKPLTQILVGKGHTVTVISHNPERTKEIEAIGAKAAIGSIEDADFLITAFTGADVVFCLESAYDHFFDPNFDLYKHMDMIGNNFVQAIEQSGVKRVVHLSSIGAHTNKGVGMLAFHYNVEQILEKLPADVSISFMRPVGFFKNLLTFIPTIKKQGAIVTNYGGDEKEPWVADLDIADAVAEELTIPMMGRKVRYIASEEISPNELATLLGTAIGKPDLKWLVIPDEKLKAEMIAAGRNPIIAAGMVEMNAGRSNGVLYADYHRNKPAMGKVRLADFAKEFAALYNQQ